MARGKGKGFHVNHDDGDQDGDHGLWNNNPYRHEEELSGSEEQETELGLDAASGARKKSSGDDDDSDDYYNGLVCGLEGADAKEQDTPYRPDPQSGHEAGRWTPHTCDYGEPKMFRWDESLSLTESSSLSNSIISDAKVITVCEEATLIYKDYSKSPAESDRQFAGRRSTASSQNSGGSEPGDSLTTDTHSTASYPSTGLLATLCAAFGRVWSYSPSRLHSSASSLSELSSSESNSQPTPKTSRRGMPSETPSILHQVEQFALQHRGQSDFDNAEAALLSRLAVNAEVDALRRSSRRAEMNEGYLNGNEEEEEEEVVVKDFEEVEDRLVQYQQLDAFGDTCLDWYTGARQASHVIPTLGDSINTPLSLLSLQTEHSLVDDTTHWFEPQRAFSAKYRLLVVHAVGLRFSIDNGKYYIVPVVLKNGAVAGFWQDAAEAPCPRWRPILSIRMRQPFPLGKNAVELALEAGFADHVEVRKRFHEDFGGDLWLERAGMELSSLPKGCLPVGVDVPSMAVCMHLMGWRPDAAAMKGVDRLPLTVHSGEEVFLFRSFTVPRPTLSKHLVPAQLATMWSTSQGTSVASFPHMFDTQKAFNHLLLLPGGNRSWSEQFGHKAMFRLFFEPLIRWLRDPLGFSDLRLANKSDDDNDDDQQCSPYMSPYDSMVVPPTTPSMPAIPGSRNKAELPDDFVPIHSPQGVRDYCLVSTNSIPLPPSFPLSSSGGTTGQSLPTFSPSASPISSTMAVDSPSTFALTKSSVPSLTLHNPLVDLVALEDGIHFFNDACLAGQTSASAGAEILFSRLIYRCCTILTLPAHDWVGEKYAPQAQRGLLKVRTLFLNQVNRCLKTSTAYDWPLHTNWEGMSAMECYLIYYRFVTLTF